MSFKVTSLFRSRWYFHSAHTPDTLLAMLGGILDPDWKKRRSGEMHASSPEMYPGVIQGNRFVMRTTKRPKRKSYGESLQGEILRDGSGSLIVVDSGIAMYVTALLVLAVIGVVLFLTNNPFAADARTGTTDEFMKVVSFVFGLFIFTLLGHRIRQYNFAKDFTREHLNAKEVDGKFVLAQADNA